MSVSQSDASRLFGHEASEDAPEQSPDMEGQITDSSSSESSSGSESEPEEQEESEEEPTPSQLQVQVAEGPVRSGSFISHSEPQEGYICTQHTELFYNIHLLSKPTFSNFESLSMFFLYTV